MISTLSCFGGMRVRRRAVIAVLTSDATRGGWSSHCPLSGPLPRQGRGCLVCEGGWRSQNLAGASHHGGRINDLMTTSTLDRTQLLDLYRGMVLIRKCEEQLARSHQKGLIHGACHTYVGQEAIAVGVCAHLRPRRRGLQHASRARPCAGQGGDAAAVVRRAVRPARRAARRGAGGRCTCSRPRSG